MLNHRNSPCGIGIITPADATPCHDESARCDVVSDGWRERRRTALRQLRHQPQLPRTRLRQAQSPRRKRAVDYVQRCCIRDVVRSWRQSSCSWWALLVSCKSRATPPTTLTHRRGVRI